MPKHVSLDSFLTAETKTDELAGGPLSSGCFIALKYVDGYFSLGHIGKELYLNISKLISDAVQAHGRMVYCCLYHTEQQSSVLLHNALKMQITHMLQVYSEWGTPKRRSESCYVYNKILVTVSEPILKYPREKIREILAGIPQSSPSQVSKKLKI
jgi:hypothetical protein